MGCVVETACISGWCTTSPPVRRILLSIFGLIAYSAEPYKRGGIVTPVRVPIPPSCPDADECMRLRPKRSAPRGSQFGQLTSRSPPSTSGQGVSPPSPTRKGSPPSCLRSSWRGETTAATQRRRMVYFPPCILKILLRTTDSFVGPVRTQPRPCLSVSNLEMRHALGDSHLVELSVDRKQKPPSLEPRDRPAKEIEYRTMLR